MRHRAPPEPSNRCEECFAHTTDLQEHDGRFKCAACRQGFGDWEPIDADAGRLPVKSPRNVTPGYESERPWCDHGIADYAPAGSNYRRARHHADE